MVPLDKPSNLALAFLFQRLKWPVPMSRWRTAREIRDLLNNRRTRSSATDALLKYLGQCKTESETCEVLTIVFLASPEARPAPAVLFPFIRCPSVLAEIILERTYGHGNGIGGWRQAHSGPSPADFRGDSYFEEHKTAHVPPILLSNLSRLERASGRPFVQHWAYEWNTLCNKLGTRWTRYPNYFDNVLETRAGIIGQYWQRMREVYLSAYLRTIAFAVSEWGMPRRTAEGYCVEILPGVAGLFDIDPGTRPAWLSDLPERFCTPEIDFGPLVRELVQTARYRDMRLVSLRTPVASSVQKYAKLSLGAYLVTPDYRFSTDAIPDERLSLMSIADDLELKGPRPETTLEDVSMEDEDSGAVAVCQLLMPIPFGSWQGDYLNTGLAVPATYITGDAGMTCTNEGINLISPEGTLVSQTSVWNDQWVPQYPKTGSTRCGMAVMMNEGVLNVAQRKYERALAWVVKLHVWQRESEYGEYRESVRSAFVSDGCS